MDGARVILLTLTLILVAGVLSALPLSSPTRGLAVAGCVAGWATAWWLLDHHDQHKR